MVLRWAENILGLFAVLIIAVELALYCFVTYFFPYYCFSYIYLRY